MLEKFGNIPIDNATIYAAMGNYNFPRNKVARMEQDGELIRLKNGLFVVSPEISRKQLSRELLPTIYTGLRTFRLKRHWRFTA